MSSNLVSILCYVQARKHSAASKTSHQNSLVPAEKGAAAG